MKNYKNDHILYTIQTWKRVDLEVDESVLKSTRYTKQSVNQTTLLNTQLHTIHQDLHLTTFTYTLHPTPS